MRLNIRGTSFLTSEGDKHVQIEKELEPLSRKELVLWFWECGLVQFRRRKVYI